MRPDLAGRGHYALQDEGLGAETLPCLVRRATRDERNLVTARQHFDSIFVNANRGPLGPITLIDAGVATGNSFLAAASKLAAAYPEASIRAFAIIRMLPARQTTDSILEPYITMLSS